jgi:methionyl-tRNA synthetase
LEKEKNNLSVILFLSAKILVMNKYYLTTTLPYVNADPHIGFALEIVQADSLARFKRIKGYEVFFNTGTDEHGQKIYQKAVENNQDLKEYCDFWAEKFSQLKEKLNLSYNSFIRTTDEKTYESRCRILEEMQRKRRYL